MLDKNQAWQERMAREPRVFGRPALRVASYYSVYGLLVCPRAHLRVDSMQDG